MERVEESGESRDIDGAVFVRGLRKKQACQRGSLTTFSVYFCNKGRATGNFLRVCVLGPSDGWWPKPKAHTEYFV